ncbi:hypothetical protein AAMO2058_000992100 [Amorphochlora amoebiformis]
MELPSPRRTSARIASVNSKYAAGQPYKPTAKRVRIPRNGSPKDRKHEYESPRNFRLPRSSPMASNRPVRRTMTNSSISSSDNSDGTASPVDAECNNRPTPDPIELISAAATTVEFHEQYQELSVLEHQCRVVQQDFDFMLAEKDEIIHKKETEARSAVKRAAQAEAKLRKFEGDMMALKCRMFELTAEVKKRDALLTRQKMELNKVDNVVVPNERKSRKRKLCSKEETHLLEIERESRRRARVRRGSF